MLFSAVTGRHRKTRGRSRTRDLLAVWQPALTSILRILFVKKWKQCQQNTSKCEDEECSPHTDRSQAFGNRTHNLLAVSAIRGTTVSWPAYCDDTSTLLLLPLAMIVCPAGGEHWYGSDVGTFSVCNILTQPEAEPALGESALCCVYVA